MIDISKIPSNPGCYIYKDKDNNIIYVGKAKNLKKRVSSYFQKKEHDAKTQSLVENIHSVDYIVTDNEIESLILENTLIKKHKPKYNIDLKDSKRYAFIQITDEDFPRLLIAREKKGDVFGPFVSGLERDYILDVLRKTYKLRACKKMAKKPCLRFHIGLCEAPCQKNISVEYYGNKIKEIKQILNGHTDKIVEQLNEQMKTASEGENFEVALMLRDRINSLTGLSEHQKMERQKRYNEDIINYLIADRVYLLVFNVYKGTLANKTEFVFDIKQDFLEEFLLQFYSENTEPKEIIIPEEINDSLHEYLQGKNIRIIIPQKGDKKQLLELAKKNIEITFFGDKIKLEALRHELKLSELPKVIECFDISHLSGTSTVGSMVQFRNGKPDKSNYRRFRIKTVTQIDDFASIAEVVNRRYSRLKNENLEMPNLIIIDGGMGQLHSAIDELKKLELTIPIISLAKRLEEIYFPGLSYPLQLDRKNKALQYLQAIRDEAHRFAIKYNRLLRNKKAISEKEF